MTKMSRILSGAGGVWLACGGFVSGQVTWDGGGEDGFWDTAENWSDDAVPAAGNDYVVEGATVISPDTNETAFEGDSLTVENGGTLNLYRTNGGGYFTVEHAIPSLTLSDAELRPESSLGSIGHILTEAVALTGANTLNMNENSAFTMRMFFDGGVTGSGSLDVTRDATGSTRSFAFGGDASGYSGDISLAGVGSGDTMIFDVDNSAGWGGGELTLGDFTALNLVSGFDQPEAGLVMDGPETVVEVPSAGVSFGNLTQNGGTLHLEITTGDPDPVADAVTLSGDYTAAGGKIVLEVVDSPLTDTPYTLVDYGGALSSEPVIEVVDSAGTFLLSEIDYGSGSGDAITVTFSEFTGTPDDLVWTGAVDDVWDVETTENWSDAGSPATFSAFDNVIFDDTAGGPEVGITLDVQVMPDFVDFLNETTDYVLSGSGSITGAALVTVDGGGTATIATDNGYEGGTDIYEGTVRVGAGGESGTLGTGPVFNDDTLVFDRSDVFVFSPGIEGFGSVEQAGAGTLVLTGSHEYSGATTVSSGTLRVGDGGSSTPPDLSASSGLTVAGGAALELPRLHSGTTETVEWALPALDLEDESVVRFVAETGSNAHNVTADLNAGGDVLIENIGGTYSQNVSWSGAVSGSGTITIDADSGSSDRLVNFGVPDSGYTGDWVIRHTLGGTPDAVVNAAAANALGAGTVTVESGARLQNTEAGGLDSLAGVVLAAETAGLRVGAETTVQSLSGSGGTVEITAGTLTLSAPGIPDGGDVAVTTGASLNLTFSGSDDVRDFLIDGTPQVPGTWGAEGSGAENETALITGGGMLNVAGSDPFPTWIAGVFPDETDPAVIGKDADPDGDGETNLVEFATNGDPADPAASGKVVGATRDVGGEEALTLTLPVRAGAAFSGDTELVTTIDGVTYRIQGGDDLAEWTATAITEVTPALADDLPALEAGWEYRTFRTPDAVADDPRDFIRALIEDPDA